MNTIKISSIIAVLLLTIVTTPKTEAYFTTSQTATTITDTTALYSISYLFGHPKYDLYLPILTERTTRTEADKDDRLAYSVREDSKNLSQTGTATALVLSNATIVNGMYKIPAGESRSMTFFAVLTTEADSSEAKYALQIEKLPFMMDIENNEIAQGLNVSELQYYVTPEARLNAE